MFENVVFNKTAGQTYSPERFSFVPTVARGSYLSLLLFVCKESAVYGSHQSENTLTLCVRLLDDCEAHTVTESG